MKFEFIFLLIWVSPPVTQILRTEFCSLPLVPEQLRTDSGAAVGNRTHC